MGEEPAYWDRRKLKLADRATAEPVRIVISTDSKNITPEHAAAFIAAAKLAQQFRPLEIWWQGAWLKEDTCANPQERGFGHVFLVPLVNGDLDFSRLQFVLSDTERDKCSFMIMTAHAYPAHLGSGGKVGEQSYLPDTSDFVRESAADEVAQHAALWAGLEAQWEVQINPRSARQYWSSPTSKSFTVDKATRQRWDREYQEQQQRERKPKPMRPESEPKTSTFDPAYENPQPRTHLKPRSGPRSLQPGRTPLCPNRSWQMPNHLSPVTQWQIRYLFVFAQKRRFRGHPLRGPARHIPHPPDWFWPSARHFRYAQSQTADSAGNAPVKLRILPIDSKFPPTHFSQRAYLPAAG